MFAILLALALTSLHPSTLDGETPKESLKEALRQLRDPYPDARARAVRKLAKIGTPEAWRRVRQALEDPEPQVADAAQRAMGTLEQTGTLSDWLGRDGLGDRDRWVRLRVAQVAGVVKLPVEVRPLAAALSTRDVALARALCASLESQARAGRLRGRRDRAVERLAGLVHRARDPRLAADALGALVALDPNQAEHALERSLGGDEPLLRAAAILLAPAGPGGPTPALEHLDDSDPRVRRACLKRIEELASRTLPELLVERLEREERLALRLRILDDLRALSGRKYSDDVRPWRSWLATLAPDWTPPTGDGEARSSAEEGEGRTHAAGLRLPLESDRLCILLDLSGSLWNLREDGHSRKELLDRAVEELLERMPSTTHFNLIPYATDPSPWRDALVPATPRNVRGALAWFADLRLTGKGNVWDALLLALDDPAVDTVLIVSDGAPTGGHRWDLNLMAELIERERRWSGVAVSSVLVDASRRLELRWQEIAERTGGHCETMQFDGGGVESRR